jgi:hypothetical protein
MRAMDLPDIALAKLGLPTEASAQVGVPLGLDGLGSGYRLVGARLYP